jgi:DNA-binding response OmpR family regulator
VDARNSGQNGLHDRPFNRIVSRAAAREDGIEVPAVASKQRILVIEDDRAIRLGLVDALQLAGYDTLEAADGPKGLETALAAEVDLVLLDLMLPKMSGLDVLAQLRPDRPALPVIVLTALGAEDDRVKGLDLGADDYVVKPFSVRELLARVTAVLRRTPGRPVPAEHVAIPGGQADLEHRMLCFDDGRRCDLSDREAELLRYLASHPGRAVSRDEILLHVWKIPPRGVETRTIDMHVARLREKLGATDVVKTVRGKGYMFDPDGGVT